MFNPKNSSDHAIPVKAIVMGILSVLFSDFIWQWYLFHKVDLRFDEIQTSLARIVDANGEIRTSPLLTTTGNQVEELKKDIDKLEKKIEQLENRK